MRLLYSKIAEILYVPIAQGGDSGHAVRNEGCRKHARGLEVVACAEQIDI